VLGGQTVSAIQAIAPSNSIQTGYVTAVDGLYVNTGQRLPSTASDQDVGRYIGVVQGPFGGNVWALNTDVVRNGIPNASYYAGVPSGVGSSSPGTPGAIPAGNGTVEAEFDLTNWDQDCLTGAQPSFCVGLYLTNAGKYASWSAIYLDQVPEVSYPSNTITGATWSSGIVTFTTGTAHGIGVGDYATVSGVAPSGYNGNFVVIATPTTTTFTVAIASNPGTKTGNGTLAAYSNYGWHNGIWFNGSNIDKDNDILLQTNANAGITVQGSHALADMVAGGNSTYGFLTGGTHSAFEIYAQGSAPSGVGVVGTRTGAGFNDGTTSPYGYYENGTHSTADFYSVGTSNYGMYLGGTYTTAALIAGGTQVNGIISQPSNVGGTSTDFYANGATAIGLTVNGTHTNSDIYVPGIGPAGVNVVGTHSSSAYQENATSAVGFNASGIHATYGDFYSGGTSVYGVRLVGTYSGAAISMTNGFKECFNGTTDCLLHTGSVLAYQPSGSTVASISDTGALALSGTATITDATDSGFGLTLAATGTGGRTFQILATQNGNGVGNGVLDFYDTNASASRLSINQYGVGINTTAQASGNALTVIGNLVASTYTVGSTNGVSCSGTPTASFASVSGIVTHC